MPFIRVLSKQAALPSIREERENLRTQKVLGTDRRRL
jgi:hypothetical protein